MSVTPSRQGTYTGRRQRAPTLDAIWDSLISDLADLEVSVSDSPTSHFLHHKRYSKLESPYLPSKPPKRDPPSPVPPTTRLAHRRYTSVKKPPPQPIVVTETSPDSERLVSLPSLPHTRFRGISESVRLSRILPIEKSPRFPHSNYRDKLKGYHPSIREQSQEEMKELWERIEENKNAVRRYAPEERIKTLREKAMHEDVRIQISKATRDEIALSRRKRLEDDLNNKLRRFEWRMNAASISIGKMRWTGLVGAFAVLGIWDQKMRNRRRILAFFLVMSISCGKILLSVRSKRTQRALIVLRRLTPFAVRWAKQHKQKKAEMLTDFIEQSQSRDMLVRIIAVWKSRIIAVQRGIKAWLRVRQAQKEFLLVQWERLEALGNGGKGTKAAGFVMKELRSESVVPQRIKEIMLWENLKGRTKDYANRVEDWLNSCELLKTDRISLLKDDPLAQPPPILFPPKPRFRLPLSMEALKGLVLAAEKKKSRWDRLSKETKQRSKPGFLNVP